MQGQYSQHAHYMGSHSEEPDYINQDLVKLRQMNQAFAKINEHHLYTPNQYYSYQPQNISQLQSFATQDVYSRTHEVYSGAQDVYSVQQSLQQRESEDVTERSNSLLFTLSQKDEEETRPTTNVQQLQYNVQQQQYDDELNGKFAQTGRSEGTNGHFSNTYHADRFGSYEYDRIRQMTVNNTLSNNGFYQENAARVHQVNPYFAYNPQPQQYHTQQYPNPNQQQHYAPQSQTYDQHEHSASSNGFSKYEEFAVKISKLFNIHVEDLEIIYNQLKFQKETQYQKVQQIPHSMQKPNSRPALESVQISDSEVMKKLFSYALEIKNSHNKLKNMITTIDHRKNNSIHYQQPQTTNIKRHERPKTHIPSKNQLENISINFMLEQQHPQNQGHLSTQLQAQIDAQTQRIQHNKHQRSDSQNIESHKTIIDKLLGPKSNFNSELISQQTILSQSSYADSTLTNTKTNKSKKKSRVTDKIKLISEQLESLKKEIDQEDDVQPNNCEQAIIQETNSEQQRQKTAQHFTSDHQQNITVNEKHPHNYQPSLEKQHSVSPQDYLPEMKRQISQYVIQVNQSQPKAQITHLNNSQANKTPEPHTFGGESFTYMRSIEQLPMDDPQIDFKIQQTIKTCIVKSPSKKSIPYQPIGREETFSNKHIVEQTSAQDKNSQKLIVEQAQASISHSKFSFRQNSQFSAKDNHALDKENSETMITSPTKSQSREKMFKSIAEMRKNQTSEQKNLQSSHHHQSKNKTTNNAYLDDQNDTENKSQDNSFHKNVFQGSAPIAQVKNSGNFAKPKFYTKQVMRDGKLVFEKNQIVQSKNKIRSPNDERKETANFAVMSPSQSEKLIKLNESFQINTFGHQNQANASFHSTHEPVTYQSNIFHPQLAPMTYQRVSNTLLEPSEANKKPLSIGAPSSLYSARTIESRPFIQSQKQLPRPSFKAPVYVMPNLRQQNYEYVPKMVNFKQNVNTSSPVQIFRPSAQMRPVQQNNLANQNTVQTVRPLTPQKSQQIIRPVTPINKIQNISVQVGNRESVQMINTEKPRSFSVQKIIAGQKIQFRQNYVPMSQVIPNHNSQIRILQNPLEKQNIITSKPQILNTPVIQNRVIQRPFSVPIRSLTPERKINGDSKQTLIEKPKVVQSNYTLKNQIMREQQKTHVAIKQFDVKPQTERTPQKMVSAPQKYQYLPVQMSVQRQQQKNIVHQQQPKMFAEVREQNSSNPREEEVKSMNQSKDQQNLPQDFKPALNGSVHRLQQPSNFYTKISQPPQIPQLIASSSQQLLRNPRLEESEMYYGHLKESIKTPNTQIPTHYKEMNLMSSRRTDSVVHTFPVQLEQSTKMNNSVYAVEEVANPTQLINRAQNPQNKPYGQIITYQPLTSAKNPFSQQPARIPNTFRPPKYVQPKQLSNQQPRPATNMPQQNHQQSLQKRTPYPDLSDSSRPPIKTYTMGRLLQASRTQNYMQESIADDKKSNTALNASQVHVRVNELHDSTPSFGRIQEENGFQSLVVSPFSKQLSNLNQSRNSSVSRRSSSSRSKSNRKGIALQSKREKSGGHKFFQSSYNS